MKKNRRSFAEQNSQINYSKIIAIKYFNKRAVIFLTTYAQIYLIHNELKYTKTTT